MLCPYLRCDKTRRLKASVISKTRPGVPICTAAFNILSTQKKIDVAKIGH